MAVRFDAATDKISYSASAPPDPQAGFSLSMWVYLSVDQGSPETMCRIWGASDTTRLTLATNVGGTTPTIFTPGNTGGVAGVDPLSVGQWVWIGITQTGTTVTLYTSVGLGTVHSASGTASGGNVASGITFGGRSPSMDNEWFNGRVGYPRYWSAVLLQAELTSERPSAVPVRTANLWSDWPLVTASDLTDHFGGHDLVAGSTAVTTEDGPPVDSGTVVTGSGNAIVTLAAIGAGTKAITAAGASLLGLEANGVGGKVAAGQGSGAITLTSSGLGVRAAVGEGAAPITLTAQGVSHTARRGQGAAVLTLGAHGASGDQQDITLTISEAPPGWEMVPVPPRWRFWEA